MELMHLHHEPNDLPSGAPLKERSGQSLWIVMTKYVWIFSYLWPEGRNPRVGTPSGGIRENGAS